MCFVYKHEDMNFTSNLLLFSILTELRFAWKIPQCWGTHVNEFGQWVFEAVFPSFCCLYLLRSLRDNLCLKKKKKKLQLINEEASFEKNIFLENWAESTELPPIPFPHVCIPSSFNITHQSNTFVKINKSRRKHHYSLKSKWFSGFLTVYPMFPFCSMTPSRISHGI